jgi:Fe-S-cluster containining protein
LRFDYPQNISFTCTKCGLCCGDTPRKTRHILLLQKDAERITAHTNQDISSFATKTAEKSPYVYEMHKSQDGKCAFLQNNQCILYDVRPLICRFYPFELSTNENDIYNFKVTHECPEVSSNSTLVSGKRLDARHFRELLDLACAELINGTT